MKSFQRFIPLQLMVLLPLLGAGCSANQISAVYMRPPGGASVGSGAIHSYAAFTDIKDAYRIQGMISAETLYGVKWRRDSAALSKKEAEEQEALVRKAAAGLGANSLVGLTCLNHPTGSGSRSCAIVVNTGVPPNQNQPLRPRFIVCVLPVRVNTGKTNLAIKLETYLTPELQFHLAQKGYYTYRCNSTRVDMNGLGVDQEIPAELREPLGVAPDFILTCEIEEGGDTRGFNIKTIRMRVALYDLQQKMTVWEDVQSMVGWSLADYLLLAGGREGSASAGGMRDTRAGVHQAVEDATKKLSAVSGFGKLRERAKTK
jgi:hypothetical protein